MLRLLLLLVRACLQCVPEPAIGLTLCGDSKKRAGRAGDAAQRNDGAGLAEARHEAGQKCRQGIKTMQKVLSGSLRASFSARSQKHNMQNEFPRQSQNTPQYSLMLISAL
jgi:hypothetical protein